jgi:hypothetical protein
LNALALAACPVPGNLDLPLKRFLFLWVIMIVLMGISVAGQPAREVSLHD